MSSRTLIRVALVITLLGSSPAVSHAQLRDVQENGWSTLKEAYTLVDSMANDKSKRTGKNFRTALDLTSTSMVKMKGSIEKMGDRVADLDKPYAYGLRDNILEKWNAVAKEQDWVKRTYEAVEKEPRELEKIEGELKNLRTAMENYEKALIITFGNYHARWDHIKDQRAKIDGDLKSAMDKVKVLEAKHNALIKEVDAIEVEMDKTAEERKKISKIKADVVVQMIEINIRKDRALGAGKLADYTDAQKDMDKLADINMKNLNLSLNNTVKARELNQKLERLENERMEVFKDFKAAQKPLEGAEDPLKLLARYSLWDNEFPALKIKFKSLK